MEKVAFVNIYDIFPWMVCDILKTGSDMSSLKQEATR
jgi:hypothetical protein